MTSRNECRALQHAERDSCFGSGDDGCSKKCSDEIENPGCRKSSGIRDDDRSIRKYKHHRGADLHDVVFRLSAKVEISD